MIPEETISSILSENWKKVFPRLAQL